MVFSVFSAGAPPCKDCSDRHMNCHAGCERYKSWRADLSDKRDHEKQENMYCDYSRDRNKDYSQRLWKGSHAFKRKYKGKPIKK